MTIVEEHQSKRSRRRAAKKEKKKELSEKEVEINKKLAVLTAQEQQQQEVGGGVDDDTEFVAADDIDEDDPYMDDFKAIFKHFSTPEELAVLHKKQKEERLQEDLDEENGGSSEVKKERSKADQAAAAAVAEQQQQMRRAANDDREPKKLSRRERKMKNRLNLPQLKQQVDRPEVVDTHDCNSSDPRLLVHLKAYRNTVPVPDHWSHKRKYLQNKRGYEKPAFELPGFIASTGITNLRAATNKDDKKNLKTKQRERMQPRLGKIDIDYQVLHDAFFRHQTRPVNMTGFGNMYYEGKEFEVKLKALRPGELSPELMRALGMNDKTTPAPWLYNMQRYGPPPAYPNLKIPGVNTPIPQGARYGYNPGEWGRPPVDERTGKPIYGDVYGQERKPEEEEEKIIVDKTHWGNVQQEEDDDEDEDEEEDGDDDEEDMASDADSSVASESVSSMTSGTSTGLDTPELLQLRKKDGTGTETPEEAKARALYTVLEEKKAAVGTSTLFGSSHTYAVPAPGAVLTAEQEAEKKVEAKKNKMKGQVNVSLNPEELESLDAATLKKKYDNQLDAESAKEKMVVRADTGGDDEGKKRKGGKDKEKKKFKF